jgi:hypothetical protein
MGFKTIKTNTSWSDCTCVELRCRHWNNFSMADIPRATITKDMNSKEVALFERYNQACEDTELLWIELEIKALEKLEAQKQGKTSRYKDRPNRMGIAGQYAYENRKITEEMLGIDRDQEYALFEDCPEDIMNKLSEELEIEFK